MRDTTTRDEHQAAAFDRSQTYRDDDRPSARDLVLDAMEPTEPLTEGPFFDALQRSAAAQREHDKFMADIYQKRNEEWWS